MCTSLFSVTISLYTPRECTVKYSPCSKEILNSLISVFNCLEWYNDGSQPKNRSWSNFFLFLSFLVLVLISTHIEWVSVSRMRDFFYYQGISSEISLCRIQSLEWCTASMPISLDTKTTRPGKEGGENCRPCKYEGDGIHFKNPRICPILVLQ